MLAQRLRVDGPGEAAHIDVRVESRKLLDGAGGARRTNVGVGEQEARGKVVQRRWCLVVHMQLLDASKRQVLRKLGTEARQPNHQHFRLGEAVLRRVAQNIELA